MDAFGHPLWHWPAVQAALEAPSGLVARIVAAPVTVDTFVRAPLNSVVGQKSRFLADYDHANDGDDSVDAGMPSAPVGGGGGGGGSSSSSSSLSAAAAAAAAPPPPPVRADSDGFDDLDEFLAGVDWEEAAAAGPPGTGALPVAPQPQVGSRRDEAQQDDEREGGSYDDSDVGIDGHSAPADSDDADALDGRRAAGSADVGNGPGVPATNITDAVCGAFGWRYDPRNPGRHVYTPPVAASGASSAASSSSGGAFEREWAPASVSVEQLALAYYHENGGWRGLHCEGGPLISLCTLLHWDVLFDGATPDTFITPYQDAPLDIDVPGVYYANRASLLQARWRAIASMDRDALAGELQRVWLLHEGTVCRGMPWRHYPLELLQLIAVGMGGPALACICDALAFNRKQFGSGLPDLLLWRVTTSSGGAVAAAAASSDASASSAAAGSAAGSAPAALSWLPRDALVEVLYSEVKGPRDTLSEKQEVWLRLLSQSGVRAALCRIVEKAREPKREPASAKGQGKGTKKAAAAR